MQRVMIVGGPGSGKSTLARLLGKQTGLPVFHMDQIHWQPGWIERAPVDKDRMTRDVHMQASWIFEGNYSRTIQERINRADTYIWLDLPTWRRLWRVVQRTIRTRGTSRPDLPHGCSERLNMETLKFFAYIVRTRRTARAPIQAIAGRPPAHLTIHHLKSIREVRGFLEMIA